MTKSKTRRAKTKVLIVDDHPAVREGLALRIARQPDLEVSGEAADVAEALRELTANKPDVVVIDIALKTGNGIDLIKRIKSRDESVRMLVCSMYGENLYAERALRAGALGYITKEEATDQIIQAIRLVREGKVYLSKQMTDRMLQRAVQSPESPLARPAVEELSDRELEVFRLVGHGLDVRKIGEQMHVSPKTVETYVARIRKKLNLESGRALIQQAVQWVSETGDTNPAGAKAGK
ncbi:MAG: response regulator transcription factor [Gemmataceae bacterium]|nr:response regulator transcription factor [Gemmataceae bacterium]MCI0740068.1 response regulator transcription factor [Gemmataceae bacterium]